MKKIFLALTVIPVLILGFLLYKNQQTNPPKSFGQEIATPESQSTNSTILQFDNETIAASWWQADTAKLKLIPNFSTKSSSKEIIDTNSCKELANAGFYSKSGNPIGLFIANGQTISNWQQNTLLDGILSINELMTPRITRVVPTDSLTIAVQTGPIIKENNSFITMRITTDSEDRRTVAAITGENKLFFISLYDPNSNYSGPLLANLPQVLKTFEQKSGIVFADAINLDGGSASVFKTNYVSLEEITPVGAFFCQP